MNTTDVKFYLDSYKIVNSNLCDNINNIIRIIKEKPLNYTAEEWNNLKDNQKKEYCLIKMKESKLLNDVDAFNYWNSTYSNITGWIMDNDGNISSKYQKVVS